MQPDFYPSWEKEPRGKMKGGLSIDFEEPDCWAMGPVFDKNFCLHKILFNTFFPAYGHDKSYINLLTYETIYGSYCNTKFIVPQEV